MKVYYINEDIIQINWDKDDFSWKNTSSAASVLHIDELDPENRELCIDLMRMHGRVDVGGKTLYYMVGNELHIRDDWEEYIEDDI